MAERLNTLYRKMILVTLFQNNFSVFDDDLLKFGGQKYALFIFTKSFFVEKGSRNEHQKKSAFYGYNTSGFNGCTELTGL